MKKGEAVCFACGITLMPHASMRFCSERCREAFDHGLAPYDRHHHSDRAVLNVPLGAWRVRAGPPGIEIGSQYYASIIHRKWRHGPLPTTPKSVANYPTESMASKGGSGDRGTQKYSVFAGPKS